MSSVQLAHPKDGLFTHERSNSPLLPPSSRPTLLSPPQEIVLTSYSTVPGVDVTDTYEGRAILEEDIPAGKANLRLLSIGLQDNMDFECHILIPGDDKGVLAATTRLIVLGKTEERPVWTRFIPGEDLVNKEMDCARVKPSNCQV